MAKEIIDKQQVTSAKDKAFERLRGRHQDLNFEDEEQLYGAIDSDYSDFETQLERQRQVDSDMSERFNNDPNFAGFFLDAVSGKSPLVALIERYGDNFRDILDDPEKVEELAEANKKYLERISKEKELEAQYEKNIETSLAIADELQSEGNYSDEQIDEAYGLILEDAQQAMMGVISKEMLETKLKGLSYDEDVEEAEQVGEARAKNTRFTEKLKGANELEKLPPMIDGRNAQVSKKEKDPTLESLDKITKKGDIWNGMHRGRSKQ